VLPPKDRDRDVTEAEAEAEAEIAAEAAAAALCISDFGSTRECELYITVVRERSVFRVLCAAFVDAFGQGPLQMIASPFGVKPDTYSSLSAVSSASAQYYLQCLSIIIYTDPVEIRAGYLCSELLLDGGSANVVTVAVVFHLTYLFQHFNNTRWDSQFSYCYYDLYERETEIEAQEVKNNVFMPEVNLENKEKYE
jgi:hypothetical protein